MIPLVCSAPGKLFLSGEYAVLKGAPAVIAAVDRRARARRARPRERYSPVLKAAHEEALRALQEAGSMPLELSRVAVDSPAFRRARKKLGLGSSAAVTAAAFGFWYEEVGLPIQEHREEIARHAMEAHRAAQGGKGSGADVATAVMGGLVVFRPGAQGAIESIPVPPVHFVPIWSGKTASTTVFISAIDAFKERNPERHAALFDSLAAEADRLSTAYAMADVDSIIAATGAYGRLMDELGRASAADIVTPEHARVMELADSFEGAAKPSGAGGGDFALAVFGDAEASSRFSAACRSARLTVLPLELGAEGLRRDC